MKKFLYSLLILPTLLIAYFVYLYTHREFTPDQLSHPFVLERKGNPTSKEEAYQILKHKFFYLGHGDQITAYESEDHQYVIKLFNPRQVLKKRKFHDYKRLKRLMTLKWISHAFFKKRQRLEKVFQRYQMGFDNLRDEAGLVYVHLHSSSPILKPVHFVDQRGKSYLIPLDKTPFILQKKAILTFTYLDQLIANGEHAKAQEAVHKLKDFLIQRAKKGYTDRVHNIKNNYGFIGDQPIQIDLGKITYQKTIQDNPQEEIQKVMNSLKDSLSQSYTSMILDDDGSNIGRPINNSSFKP